MKKNALIFGATTLILLAISIGLRQYVLSPTDPAPSRQTIDISEIKDIPSQTGGIVEALPVTDQKDTDAMAAIMRQLPIYTPDFVITFNYKEGQFTVARTNPESNLSGSFDSWYSNSAFGSIPRSRFSLVP